MIRLRNEKNVKNRIFFKLLAVFLIVIAATAVILDVMLGGAWEASLRTEIERNLTQKTLLFAHRVETDRAHSLPKSPRRKVWPPEPAPPSSTPPEKFSPTPNPIPPTWRTTPPARNSPPPSPARPARTSAAAPLSAFRFSMSPCPFPGARCASPIHFPMSKPCRRRCTAACFGDRRIAFLIALLIAAAASVWTSRRLEHIVDVAVRIEQGDLRARVEDSPLDEIGRVAAAIDKTAGQVERSFAAVRSSQRQLETLLNSMQDAVIAVSSDGLVQWANQPMDRLVPQHTRLNAPVVETIRDPDFLAAVKAATTTKQVKTTRATSIVPGRAFDVTAAPLPDGGAVAVLRDLTETERVEKTRRDFIANVSHELRTPLTSIQGYSETLLDLSSENSGPNREFLEIIRKNAARMSRLTEDLLTLARVESGETRFDTESVPPVELLHDAEESFREIARSQEVDLQIVETNLDHGSGSVESLPRVRADREAIHQVFSNLIDNAMKYGRSGGRIVLGARPARRGVEFYVQDFGAGIASEHLPRLFERFYRVDKARSRESGGTGLGLAIAKHIMLAHGGSIRAESELGHGSIFLFTLPTA